MDGIGAGRSQYPAVLVGNGQFFQRIFQVGQQVAGTLRHFTGDQFLAVVAEQQHDQDQAHDQCYRHE